jgi:class 3 adenylate cyclase
VCRERSTLTLQPWEGCQMDFYAVLDQVLTLLRQRQRVTYRALQRQFQLDEETLNDLKDELLDAHSQIHDDAGRGLVWIGEADTAPPAAAAPLAIPERAPLIYTPPYLAEKILASRTALEGERKQVTVLFDDVSGFTSISAQLDPEEVHQLMNRAFGLMLDEVHRYEGTINQVLGDGIMALFGAPIAHEDHAQRAVHAALAIQQALRGYHDELQRTKGIAFRLRMGLNTGLVVVASIGDNLRMDYTAVGDTTILAHRMLELAEPGQIVVAEETHKAVRGYFVTRALGARG